MRTKRVLSRGSLVSVLPHQGRIDTRRSFLPPGPLPPAYSRRHARDGTSPHRRIMPYPPLDPTVLGTSETSSHCVSGSSGPTATLFAPSLPTPEWSSRRGVGSTTRHFAQGGGVSSPALKGGVSTS